MPLPEDEYAKRRRFRDSLGRMSVAEQTQVAQILLRERVPIATQSAGVLFDVAALDQGVMDKLYAFATLVCANAVDLTEREAEMSTLSEYVAATARPVIEAPPPTPDPTLVAAVAAAAVRSTAAAAAATATTTAADVGAAAPERDATAVPT